MPLLTEKQTAEQLAVKRNTLAIWRMSGRGPKYLKLHNGTIRYRAEEIEKFMRQSEVRTTDVAKRHITKK
jgi:predicted site-specific integrase-resolvase